GAGGGGPAGGGAGGGRDYGGLGGVGGACDGLRGGVVRGHVQGRDAGRVGRKVRTLPVFLEHQRPWMVNSSFTLSVSAAVRFDSTSGLSIITVFPPASPSPTTNLMKLAAELLLRPASRCLVAAKRILLGPGWRHLVLSSTI